LACIVILVLPIITSPLTIDSDLFGAGFGGVAFSGTDGSV
jgi:hypothetical protein